MVGFSVQRHHIEKLPELSKPTKSRRYVVADSIEGWADAVGMLMKAYFKGAPLPIFDFSQVRPKGARIITSGGKAPGPEPLRVCLERVKLILDNADTKLRPIEAHDIVCHLADAVLSGGIRRAALISLFSADDEEMLAAKSGPWWEKNPQRGRANNSASLLRGVDDHYFHSVMQAARDSGAGEPGMFWVNERETGTNPCFGPDTMIAVADGRGAVSIKQLAEEGKDIPVYSVNRVDGMVSIKIARSPRKTREGVQLVRVHLDNGSYLDVTPDHKMLLRDGSRVQAKDLEPGQSLSRFTKRQEQITKENLNKYWRVYTNTLNTKLGKVFEHRLISQFNQPELWASMYNEAKQSGWLKGGLVVHHRDYNPLNNRPENLELMSFKDHTEFHGSMDNNGESNGRYSGYTNKQIEDKAIELTKKYGRKLCAEEWYAETPGYPRFFSSWRRKDWFANVHQLLSWAAKSQNVSAGRHYVGSPNPEDRAKELAKDGYKAFVLDHKVYVTKPCGNPKCGKDMILPENNRHAVYCNNYCASSTEEALDRFVKTTRQGQITKQQKKYEAQIKVYNDLKNDLGRDPLKVEWIQACAKAKVPGRIRTEVAKDHYNPYVFHSYQELKDAAATYNHKVSRVEYLEGTHDVYNLTVDDFHTVGIVTRTTDNQMDGVFAMQCCEIALNPKQFCNLTEINVSSVVSQEDLNERTAAAAFIGTLQASYTDFHYLRPHWREITEKEALLGVSMTGIASMPDLDLTEASQIAVETNKRIAGIIGINPAARVTTVKPAGTTSLVLGCSSGIHAWHNDYYIRRIRVNKNEAIYSYFQVYHPELIEDEVFSPNTTAVISVPQKAPEEAILRTESELSLLERVKKVYHEWILPGHQYGASSHNVSATISVRPESWDEVIAWMWDNREYYNGLSVLPYDGGTYVQAPFEDITKEKYEELIASLTSVDLTRVIELDDNTTLMDQAACAGGACEVK